MKKSKVRDEVDPEFEEELKKYNFDKLFREFNERPSRKHPTDLKVMQPEFLKKFSRRDLARLKYVVKKREMNKINSKLRYRLQEERLKFLDLIEDGGMQSKSYDQLVEEINKDYKKLEEVDKPIMVYKSQQELVKEEIKKQDESFGKVKRVYYPIVFGIFVIYSIFMIGYYYQDKFLYKYELFDLEYIKNAIISLK